MVILIIVIILIAIMVLATYSQGWENPLDKMIDNKIGTIMRFSVGKYITGLLDQPPMSNNIDCAVTDQDFVFLDFTKRELGRIPRDSIHQIIVDNKSQIAQRLTVTRMLTLGVFSLAAPKKKTYEEFYLVIDWDDNKGIRQNTVFEFSDNVSANLAANSLNRYTLQKTEKLKSDEKKCPYCAEIIKAEAIKCKHCSSDLSKTEPIAVPAVTVTNKELLQRAYDLYDKIDIDGALDLLKKIILDDPNSSEAEAAKTKIKKIFSAKELLEKTDDFYDKTNSLGLFKVLIEVFPESPQAEYSKQHIEKQLGGKNNK